MLENNLNANTHAHMANQRVSVCWCVKIYKGRPFQKKQSKKIQKSSKKAARALLFSAARWRRRLYQPREGGKVGGVEAVRGAAVRGAGAVTYLRARPASAERKRWLPSQRARHLLQAERPMKKQSSNNKLTQFSYIFFLYCTQIQATQYKQT